MNRMIYHSRIGRTWTSMALLCMSFLPAIAANTWNGTEDDNWFNENNWSSIVVPGANADVIVAAAANIILTNETAELASFTMTGGTLTFSNWMTRLRAVEVILTNDTVMTLPPAFIDTQMSNRVWIVCSNFTIHANARIDARERGYAATNGPGYSTTRGTAHGGYGARGEWHLRTNCYGDVAAPTAPGSGGNSSGAQTPAGGGAIFIDADGAVTIHGEVLGDAGLASDHSSARAGSGGSVYVRCRTFGGSASGLISANGGKSRSTLKPGGGRIAIVYHAGAQAEMSPVNPGVRFDVGRGRHYESPFTPEVYAEPGTLYLPDTQFLSATMGTQWVDVRFVIPGLTEWLTPSLQVSGWIAFDPPMNRIGVAGDLLLNANSRLTLYSTPTNASSSPHGFFLDVGGALTVNTNAALDLISNRTNGAAPYVECQTLDVRTNGTIDANGRGYDYQGPSWTGIVRDPVWSQGAGGYGGRGGGGTTYGRTYGCSNAPAYPGSGGIENSAGLGGGLIRISARDTMSIAGTIRADGMINQGTASGGSGGGILLTAKSFSGTGELRVQGGNGHSNRYGGGGGRIAVLTPFLSYDAIDAMAKSEKLPRAIKILDPAVMWPSLTLNVAPGTPGTGDNAPDPGTTFFGKMRTGTVISFK